jgi:uncharacterized membrane protein YidH (DUF202 family)
MSTHEPEFEAPAPEEVVVPATVPAMAPTAVDTRDVEESDAALRRAENEEAERRNAGRSGSVKGVRVLSLLVIIAGALLIAAGAVTWYEVSRQLGDEHIVVSDDASHFSGDKVQDPITAFAQADTIQKHALAASGGQTYAQLAQDDPARQTVMTASFLRASLFTSVVSFGVAAFAVVIGVLMIMIGYALRRLSRTLDIVRNSPATAV